METRQHKPNTKTIVKKTPRGLRTRYELSAYFRRLQNGESKVQTYPHRRRESTKTTHYMTPNQISMYEIWGSPTPTPTKPIFVEDPTTGERKMIKKPSTRPYLYNQCHDTFEAEKKNMSADESIKNLCTVIREKKENKKRYGK